MIRFCDKNKKTLLITFFSTLFVHLIKFVNYYPTYDSMYGIEKSIKGMIPFGRWFSGISTNITSSPYDLQWIEGVISAILVSIIVALIFDIFDIKTPLYQYLCIGTFVTFPCVTATFIFSLWTTAYMAALLFVILAIYMYTYKKQ